MATKPTANKVELGQQVRTRRKTLGMTQAQLAASIGVSFQQMQKYEKGINAISSDRLRQICEVLSLPADFFATVAKPPVEALDPVQAGVPSPEVIQRFLASREGQRLIESFMKINDKRFRTRILDFVASVSEDEG